MSNLKEHVIVGGLAGAAAYLWFKQQRNEQPTAAGVIASAIVGLGTSMIPDILEPATNTNHRELFHSLGVSAILTSGMDNFMKKQDVTDEQKIVALSAFAGYASHLVLDAFTSRGLPVI